MRVLIIDPDLTNAADLILAHRLVRQFQEDAPKYSKGFGRHHSILYGREDTVAVWHTPTQVTVRFWRQK